MSICLWTARCHLSRGSDSLLCSPLADRGATDLRRGAAAPADADAGAVGMFAGLKRGCSPDLTLEPWSLVLGDENLPQKASPASL